MSSVVRQTFNAILLRSTYGKDAACTESINISCDENEDRSAFLQRQGYDVVVEGGQLLLIQ